MFTTALVMACSVGTDCDFGLCAGPTAGGSEGGGGEGGVDGEGGVKPPDGCDATKEPKDSPKCVSSDFGIFVSPKGTLNGTGKIDSPVNTIAAGLAKSGAIRRLYICDGAYAEHVVLKSAVSLYGGFNCDTWAHDDAIKPVVGKITESGYALDVQTVSGSFDIFDLEFGAGNGDDAFPNSIALRLVGTSGATLRRVKLTARDGLPGKKGDLGVAGSTVNHTDLVGTPNYDPTGNAGASTTSGAPRGCKCPNAIAPDDQTIGGGGSLTAASPASPGTPTLPASAGDDGASGALNATNCGLGGGTGHNGAPRAQAAGGVVATRLGTLMDGSWRPEPGANGATALPGQGGGGGSGQSTGAGSGGACGGCGGFGGKAGTGGGASIGLLTVDSPIHISGETVTGKGGRGGDGGDGGAGGLGGTGGVHVVGGGNGCPGGDGGKGGLGGAASGGAGGLSVGILTSGAAPITDGATFTLGSFGDGGTGLSSNSGPPGIKANSASVENVSTKTTM
jgi:hypothetical protein